MQKKMPFTHALLLAAREELSAVDRRALRMCGIRNVRMLSSGVEAAKELAQCNAAGPDLVICGNVLEDMPAETFVRLIRLHPQLVSFPIVVTMTGQDKEAVLKARACGYSGLLVRPYTQTTLIRQLEYAFQCREATRKALGHIQTTNTSAFEAELQRLIDAADPNRQDPSELFEKALNALRNKRWTEGIRLLQAILRRYPDNADAMLALSIAWRGRGNEQKSRSMQREAIAALVDAAQENPARLERAIAIATKYAPDSGAPSPLLEEAARLLTKGSSTHIARLVEEGLRHTPDQLPVLLFQRACANAPNPEEALTYVADCVVKAGLPALGADVRRWLPEVHSASAARNTPQSTQDMQDTAGSTSGTTRMTKSFSLVDENDGAIALIESSQQFNMVTTDNQDDFSNAHTESTSKTHRNFLREPNSMFEKKWPKLHEAVAVIKVTLGLFKQIK